MMCAFLVLFAGAADQLSLRYVVPTQLVHTRVCLFVLFDRLLFQALCLLPHAYPDV